MFGCGACMLVFNIKTLKKSNQPGPEADSPTLQQPGIFNGQDGDLWSMSHSCVLKLAPINGWKDHHLIPLKYGHFIVLIGILFYGKSMVLLEHSLHTLQQPYRTQRKCQCKIYIQTSLYIAIVLHINFLFFK